MMWGEGKDMNRKEPSGFKQKTDFQQRREMRE